MNKTRKKKKKTNKQTEPNRTKHHRNYTHLDSFDLNARRRLYMPSMYYIVKMLFVRQKKVAKCAVTVLTQYLHYTTYDMNDGESEGERKSFQLFCTIFSWISIVEILRFITVLCRWRICLVLPHSSHQPTTKIYSSLTCSLSLFRSSGQNTCAILQIRRDFFVLFWCVCCVWIEYPYN